MPVPGGAPSKPRVVRKAKPKPASSWADKVLQKPVVKAKPKPRVVRKKVIAAEGPPLPRSWHPRPPKIGPKAVAGAGKVGRDIIASILVDTARPQMFLGPDIAQPHLKIKKRDTLAPKKKPCNPYTGEGDCVV